MAWVVIGSLCALPLIAVAFHVVRSRKRKRAGLCPHCGDALNLSRTFTVEKDVLCRSCAEDTEDRHRLFAVLCGILSAVFCFSTCVISVALFSAGVLVGWQTIAMVIGCLALFVMLVHEASRASEQTRRVSRFSLACLSLAVLAFIILTVVPPRGGKSGGLLGNAIIGCAATGFTFAVQAVRFRNEAFRLSEELKT